MKETCYAAKKRPINLALTTMAFPPMAIASIFHRLSGIILFLFLPVMLYWLKLSLQDAGSFTDLQLIIANPYYKVLFWLFLSSLWYHLIAGLRHMLMDLGIGESLKSGCISAKIIIFLGIVGSFSLGVFIW